MTKRCKQPRRDACRRLCATLLSLSLMALAAPAFGAVQPGSGYGFPRDVSVDGWRIDWLINVTSVFVGGLFIVMCLWMAWMVFFHGKKHEAEYDHGSAKHSIVQALLISAVIFLVVDGNLFYNSMVDTTEAFWNFDKAEADPGAVRIEVNSRQWAWEFRYAGKDNKFNTRDDVTTLNDMPVPVNAPVIVQLGAVDVIHSFYLPNVRQKIDAVAGTITKMWFQAKETGDFDIACAQHCGTNHYKMKGMMRILPRGEYDAWLEDASEAAVTQFDAKDKEALWGWAWNRNGN